MVVHVVHIQLRGHHFRRQLGVKDILNGQTRVRIALLVVLERLEGVKLILGEVNCLFNSRIEILEGHRLAGVLGRQCWRAVLPSNHLTLTLPELDWHHRRVCLTKVGFFVRQHRLVLNHKVVWVNVLEAGGTFNATALGRNHDGAPHLTLL